MIDYRFLMTEEDLDFIDNSKILKSLKYKKDKFLVLVGYGYINDAFRPPKGKKKQAFSSNTFDPNDNGLLYAVAINRKGGIETINDIKEVYEIASAYANGGLQLLRRLENNSSHDNHLKNFEKKIKDYISKLD